MNHEQAMTAARWRSEKFGRRYSVLSCKFGATFLHWHIIPTERVSTYRAGLTLPDPSPAVREMWLQEWRG